MFCKFPFPLVSSGNGDVDPTSETRNFMRTDSVVFHSFVCLLAFYTFVIKFIVLGECVAGKGSKKILEQEMLKKKDHVKKKSYNLEMIFH